MLAKQQQWWNSRIVIPVWEAEPYVKLTYMLLWSFLLFLASLLLLLAVDYGKSFHDHKVKRRQCQNGGILFAICSAPKYDECRQMTNVVLWWMSPTIAIWPVLVWQETFFSSTLYPLGTGWCVPSGFRVSRYRICHTLRRNPSSLFCLFV